MQTPPTGLSAQPDGVLIELYRSERDQAAMRTLVERHHDPIYRRLRHELGSQAEAEACSRTLWIQLTRQLDGHGDEDRFAQRLGELATALIEEHWQRKAAAERVRAHADGMTQADGEALAGARRPDAMRATPQERLTDERIDRLVRQLIPALPVEQRAAWLLKHECERWDPARPLEWTHLAQLNGVDVADAWSLFTSARARLIGGARDTGRVVLDEEEMLVFLVWTQAQRAMEQEHYSWSYFGQLMGVPASTMQTRYDAAEQRLAEALEQADTTGQPG